jgi:hypothetical protein
MQWEHSLVCTYVRERGKGEREKEKGPAARQRIPEKFAS